MKILLINPRSDYLVKAPPLGLLCLAAYVRKMIPDLQIEIVDAHLENKSDEDLLELIKIQSPDLVGVYTISANAAHIRLLIEKLRQYVRYIVIGGPYATIYGRSIIREGLVDYAVMGEGEGPFCDLLKALTNGESDKIGIISRVLSKTVSEKQYLPDDLQISDIDSLPQPAWDLLDVEKYFRVPRNSMSPVMGTKRVLPIFTSRGCPFHCAYCHNMFGKNIRFKSAQKVFDEIKYLVKKYKIEALEIWDDVFNYDKNRLLEICRMIRESDLSLGLSFSNGIRADILDEAVVDALVDAGAQRINFGIESGTDRIQKVLCKNQDLERVERIVRYVASKGNVITGGFFIIGNPTETKEEMLQTIEYASKLPLDVASFFACTPNPGTKLYDMLSDEIKASIARIPPERFSYHESAFDISCVSHKEVRKQLKLAHLKFYFNMRRIYNLLRKVVLMDIVKNGYLVVRYILMSKTRLWYK
jgi:anaerobic magnesium-protoporphyrin IX monomethyl ester cyclase